MGPTPYTAAPGPAPPFFSRSRLLVIVLCILAGIYILNHRVESAPRAVLHALAPVSSPGALSVSAASQSSLAAATPPHADAAPPPPMPSPPRPRPRAPSATPTTGQSRAASGSLQQLAPSLRAQPPHPAAAHTPATRTAPPPPPRAPSTAAKLPPAPQSADPDSRAAAAIARLAAACDFSRAAKPLQWRVGTPAETSAGWLVDLQPPATCARNMSADDARLALAGRSIAMLGDSLTRDTFSALVYFLEFGSFAVPFGTRSESDKLPGANNAGQHISQLNRITSSVVEKEPTKMSKERSWSPNLHWWGPSVRCAPGTRLSYWSWRGKQMLNGPTAERSCMATAFDRHGDNECGAAMKMCAAERASSPTWSETIVPGLARILHDERPDIIVLNSGIHGGFQDGKDVAEHDAIIDVLAEAKRANKDLRVIWKTTTQSMSRRKKLSNKHPSASRLFVAKLVERAGAEVFDAFAITEFLGASGALGDAAYNDENHFGPAVHAQIGAALVAHLARGWAKA